MSEDKRKDTYFRIGRMVIGGSISSSPTDSEKAVTPVLMIDTAKEERASAICFIIGWWHYALSVNFAVLKVSIEELD